MKCEAVQNWKERDYPQCTRNARVEIDGVNLCVQHSGAIALRKLIQMGLVKKLDTPNPYYKSVLCER